jgi:hypothetical protein
VAVIECKEIPDGRGGGINLDRSRQWTRVFRVVTDDPRDGAPTVVQASGLPPVGTFYLTATGEVDTDAVCQSLSPAQDPTDDTVWTVTASYDTRVDTGAQAGGGSGSPGQGGAHPATRPENPLDRPVKWSAGTVKVKKSATTDKDGLDVINSAGQLYSPGYERDAVLGKITAVKNYAEYVYLDALDWVDWVNDDEWYGFPAQTVKVDDVSIAENYENGVRFVTVTWTFLYNPDGWNPTRILDRGTYYLLAGVKKTDTVLDASGNVTVVGEYLLDGSGGKVTPPTAAVYNLFRFYDEATFTGALP